MYLILKDFKIISGEGKVFLWVNGWMEHGGPWSEIKKNDDNFYNNNNKFGGDVSLTSKRHTIRETVTSAFGLFGPMSFDLYLD